MVKIWKISVNWWKNNKEKNSERYIEREELKDEWEEDSKDIKAISQSSLFDINEVALRRAILIQNLHAQRNLSKSTESLRTATWVLVFATVVFPLPDNPIK